MWICGTCQILRRGPHWRCLPFLGPTDSLLFPQVLWFCLGCCDRGLVGGMLSGDVSAAAERCWLCKESWSCIRAVPRSSVTTNLWNNWPSVTVWVAFTQHVRLTVYFSLFTLSLWRVKRIYTHCSITLLQNWRGEGTSLRGLKVQMQQREKNVIKIVLHTNLLVLPH